jgi:hypothetical protein
MLACGLCNLDLASYHGFTVLNPNGNCMYVVYALDEGE